MAGRLTLLPPGMQQIQHWSRHPAPTNDPRSSSKSQAEAPRSSTPSWPTRLAAPSTPSQATRAKRRCSRRGTAPKSPPSTGTVPVRAWFSVGRSSSAKSGWRVLSPTPSTCSSSFRTLHHSKLGRDMNQVSYVHAWRFAAQVDAAIRSWHCKSILSL
jgi:hypothetical protein